MKEVIMWLSELVTFIHDGLLFLSELFGLNLNDKQLHFWVFGILGIILFFVVHAVFQSLAKWSIRAISLIYTFTVIVVIVFAIEIQQGITNSGNMDFHDAVYGLWGFICFFIVYLIVLGLFVWIFRKNRKQS